MNVTYIARKIDCTGCFFYNPSLLVFQFSTEMTHKQRPCQRLLMTTAKQNYLKPFPLIWGPLIYTLTAAMDKIKICYLGGSVLVDPSFPSLVIWTSGRKKVAPEGAEGPPWRNLYKDYNCYPKVAVQKVFQAKSDMEEVSAVTRRRNLEFL